MNYRIKIEKRLLVCLSIASGLMMSQWSARAASMVWQSPQWIKGDNDVNVQGTLLGAYSFGTSAGGTAATVNGVVFTAAQANATQGLVTSSGASYGYTGFGGGTGLPFANLTSSYRSLLSKGLYGSTNTMTIALGGLTGGQTYLIQLWLNDSRGNVSTDLRPVRVASGASASADVVPMAAISSRGTLGQHIIGYLTLETGETGANIVVSPRANVTQLNAMQIRSSQKTAWLAEEKYGIMMHFLTGGNGGMPPSTASVGQPYSISAELTPGSTDSAWSLAVDNFDVTAFANQVAETGAGYVIFANGQTAGYYCSPNAKYEGIGGLNPGEFTSKRDLIADLAAALEPKGIKLMVYMAADGPHNATSIRRPNGQIKMQELTFFKATPPATAFLPAYDYRARANLNAMIKEWSDRWAGKVAGWWFDGVYENTGYTNSSDNNDGPGNISALIAAAKSGNPSALVAVNPGAEKTSMTLGDLEYTLLSADQDYMAGETASHRTLNAKFSRYPRSQFVNFGGKDMLWHVMSYVGYKWREPNQKYVNEELISYIDTINKKGGVVTLDVAFLPNGQIIDTHFQQLKRLKSALKPSVLPVVAHVPPATFVNLALFKPSFTRSNNGASPGRNAEYLLGANGGQYYAHSAVDGSLLTKAQAGGEYAWNLVVDLEDQMNFDRVAVHFFDPSFATSYEITYSSNGLIGSAGNWQHLAGTPTTYLAATTGLKIHDANAMKTGRYIKIKAITPNAAGQTGGQMAIAEFEVYNVNGAAQTSKDTVWVDEKVPTDATLTAASGSSWQWDGLPYDGWAEYHAVAADSAWTPVHGALRPKDGQRVHWSPLATGWNEHGFENTKAPLHVASGDDLYTWVWIDPAQLTDSILLEWTASDGTKGEAYWGANSLGSTGPRVGNLPTAGQWTKLSVSANSVGLGGKKLTGMSFAQFNGKVVFDRSGKTTP